MVRRSKLSSIVGLCALSAVAAAQGTWNGVMSYTLDELAVQHQTFDGVEIDEALAVALAESEGDTLLAWEACVADGEVVGDCVALVTARGDDLAARALMADHCAGGSACYAGFRVVAKIRGEVRASSDDEVVVDLDLRFGPARASLEPAPSYSLRAAGTAVITAGAGQSAMTARATIKDSSGAWVGLSSYAASEGGTSCEASADTVEDAFTAVGQGAGMVLGASARTRIGTNLVFLASADGGSTGAGVVHLSDAATAGMTAAGLAAGEVLGRDAQVAHLQSACAVSVTAPREGVLSSGLTSLLSVPLDPGLHETSCPEGTSPGYCCAEVETFQVMAGSEEGEEAQCKEWVECCV